MDFGIRDPGFFGPCLIQGHELHEDDKNASLPVGFFSRWVQENLRLRRDLELSRAMLSRQGDPKTI